MKKNIFIKILVITGIVLCILGGTIFTIAMSVNGWDFGVLASHVVETKIIEFDGEQVEKITDIKVDVATADIKILYHDEQKITVQAYDLKSRKGEITDTVDVSARKSNLEIIEKNKKIINFQTGIKGKTEIIVKIPKGKVLSLSATLTTGDVYLFEENNDCQLENVKITLTTGDVYFNGDLTCEAIAITSSTGDTFVNGKINTGTLEKECSTGDFIINKSIVAGKIDVEQGTGKVECRAFITANEIDIETTTGDVLLKLLGSKEDYSYMYEISTGKSNIPSYSKGEKSVEIETTTGDVAIYFEK